MPYNFSLMKPAVYAPQVMRGVQFICWLLAAVNLCCPSIYQQAKPVIRPQAAVIFPRIIPNSLAFIEQFSLLDMRLLSTDIYPQELVIKGVSFEARTFLKFLKNLHRFPHIQQDELLDWHRQQDGTWFFSLRMVFKS